jgi:hypothetical protein
MAELAVARAEVEAVAAVDAARATAAELEALRTCSTGISVSADDDRDNEFKLARDAAPLHPFSSLTEPTSRSSRSNCVRRSRR